MNAHEREVIGPLDGVADAASYLEAKLFLHALKYPYCRDGRHDERRWP